MVSGEDVGSGARRSRPISCSLVALVVLRRVGVGEPVLGSVKMLSGCGGWVSVCSFSFVFLSLMMIVRGSM